MFILDLFVSVGFCSFRLSTLLFFLFLLGSIWFFLLLFWHLFDSVLFGSISFFQNNPNALWFYSVLPDSVQLDSIWFNFIFGWFLCVACQFFLCLFCLPLRFFSSGFVCVCWILFFRLFFILIYYVYLIPSGYVVYVRFCFVWSCLILVWLNIFFHFRLFWFCYGLFNTFLFCPVWFYWMLFCSNI